MTIPVKIKRSGTTTSTPSSLDHGELAINYADSTLFWKDATNTIRSFVFQAYASATHKSQHATGGSDALSPSDIGAAPAASPTFTGVVSLADGSVGSPSLVGTDNDSGMWFPAGNTIAWSTNGKEALRIDSAQRVRVQQTATDGTGFGRLEWMNHAGVLRAFSILHGDSYAGGTSFAVGASGFALGNIGGALAIGTTTAHATRICSNGLTRIYVDSGGNVGVGTNHTSPASALDVSGVITVAAGTAAAPALVFSGDTNTGIAQIGGADTWSVVTGGVERVRVDGSGGVTITNTGTGNSFVVNDAAGDTTPFVVNASGAVGIGISAPNAPLNVIAESSSTGAKLQTWAYTAAGNENFNLRLTQAVTAGIVQWVFNQTNNATDYPSVMCFDRGNVGINKTSPATALDVNGVITVSATSGSAGSYLPSLTISGDPNTGFGQVSGQSDTASIFTAGHERVRVGSTNQVSFFNNSASSLIGGNTGITIGTGSGNSVMSLYGGTSSSCVIYFADGTSSPSTFAGYINYSHSTNDMTIATNGTGRVRVKNTGALNFAPLSADPAIGEAGDVYYNSSTNKLRVYDGTSWIDLH